MFGFDDKDEFIFLYLFQGRARLMNTAGYKTLSSVASAKPEDLVKSIQYMPRKAAKQIIASAKVRSGSLAHNKIMQKNTCFRYADRPHIIPYNSFLNKIKYGKVIPTTAFHSIWTK